MESSERVLICLLLLGVGLCRNEDVSDAEEPERAGAEYLRSVMNQLQSEKTEGQAVDVPEMSYPMDGGRATTAEDPGNATPPAPQVQPELVPASSVALSHIPPSLTAEELTAIYNAAVNKLANLPDTHGPVPQFYQPQTAPPTPSVVEPAAHGPAGSFLPGYYYYYYPIKSFLKVSPVQSQVHTQVTTTTTARPVHMTVTMTDLSNKRVEPLFMAISGFIGMALMFAFTVLFAPKFGKLRSGEMDTKHTSQDLITLARVVFESLEGKDCGERLACEIARFVRGVKMDDKPLRVLEIVLPPKLGDQVTLIRKAAAKREKCSAIPCKLKKPDKAKPKPWLKPSTAHDLWMKRFDNRTRFRQPENIWDKKRQTLSLGD